MHPATPVHPAALPPEQLLSQCRVERTRGAGPGGQRKNKVETAIRLTHPDSGVSVQAGERRHQQENQHIALKRLRLKLALEVRRESWPIRPSALWESRRQGSKLPINPKHQDFPAILAEALDAVAVQHGDAAKAATALGISTSQMIRLLKHEPEALARVNHWRNARGMHALK